MMRSNDENEIRFPFLDAAILLISISMLMFEILQTITLSLQTFQHNAFLIISLCLMGLGGGGSLATWLGRRRDLSPVHVMWWSALGFGLSLAVTAIISSRVVHLAQLIVLGFIPYVFVGVFLAYLFRAWPERANRSYFFNLVGSGLGCLGLVWLLNGTGDAALVILVVSALAMVGAVLMGLLLPSRRVVLPVALIVVLLALIPFRSSIFVFPPAPQKGMGVLVNAPGVQTEISWSKWGYLGRLDVVDVVGGIENFPHARSPMLRRYMDEGCDVAILFAAAGNWTAAIDFKENDDFRDTFVREALHSSPYLMNADPDVLNIGFGGGVDLFLACQNGSKTITGIDINPLMIEAGRKALSGYYSDFYNDPRVNVQVMDGRSFVRNTEQKFDVITLTAVDTGELLHSSAKVHLEGYLYTEEAFDDYLSILKPGGFVYLHRPYKEMMRLANTGVTALRNAGVENPEENLAIIGEEISEADWGSVLIGKSPFTEEQKQTLRERYGEQVAYLPGDPIDDERYLKFFDAVSTDSEVEYLAGLSYDFTPVTDESPFFYRFHRSKFGFVASSIFLKLLLMVGVIAAVLILLPLIGSKPAKETGGKSLFMVLLYFGSIGIAFMFIEVSLIQKLVLFLGHPSYSVTVALFSILIFSGLGSVFAKRFLAESRRTALIIFVPILMAAIFYAVGLAPVIEGFRTDSLGVRVLIVALLLAPGSFFMGMPFPTMVGMMRGAEESLIPWAWGINSFTSVAASILTIILAMQMGFSSVLYIGAVFYAFALIVYMARVGSRAPA